MVAHNEENPSNAVLNERLNGFGEQLCRIEDTLKSQSQQFVTQHEFKPVKAIAFGAMAAIGLTVLGAIIALVIKLS